MTSGVLSYPNSPRATTRWWHVELVNATGLQEANTKSTDATDCPVYLLKLTKTVGPGYQSLLITVDSLALIPTAQLRNAASPGGSGMQHASGQQALETF